MRGTLAMSGWVGALALAVAACAGGNRDAGVAVDESSNGSTVVLAIGQELTITLRSLGDGGYSRWSITAAPDPALLEPTASRHQEPGSNSPGDSGEDAFGFRGVSAGRTSLVASATRSFSGEPETYALDVVVGGAP